ncbi:MAG: nucleoside 2-deoxyribosyltransferase [Euryarchaeota archaeon]|nr:nucleoside 2-deoxyribosyltransferase [Euryarchaeota archaeon]
MGRHIYIAAPLFSVAEREFNSRLCEELERRGYRVTLPQRDCTGDREEIFRRCLSGIEGADILIAVLEGVPCDDGTAFEVGYAFALGKRILGLRTDFRNAGEHGARVNLMLEKACDRILACEEELFAALEKMEGDYGEEAED